MNTKFPRKGSALYGMITGNKEKTKRILNRWKKINKIVIFLYEIGFLPLFGIGGFILLLYTKGRRSGKKRVTPLEYRQREGSLILFSGRGHRSDWYRNLMAYPEDVKLKLGFKMYEPLVDFISEPEELEEYLRWYINAYPKSSRFLFGWDPKRDDLETSDLSSLVNILKIVKLDINHS
jgi:deazaflavin-dependent oxidoreductase (nitroreductase family)